MENEQNLCFKQYDEAYETSVKQLKKERTWNTIGLITCAVGAIAGVTGDIVAIKKDSALLAAIESSALTALAFSIVGGIRERKEIAKKMEILARTKEVVEILKTK